VPHSGRRVTVDVIGADLGALVTDGVALYQYCRTDPLNRRDPAGLFVSGLVEFGADVLVVGVRGVRGGLEGMTTAYARNMEGDLDWAMDWSMPDDMYSRASSNQWIDDSWTAGFMGGLEAGLQDLASSMTYGLYPGSEETGPAMARMFRAGDTFKTVYRAGRAITAGDRHHALPSFLAKFFTASKVIGARLPHGLHQKYHSELNAFLQAGGLPPHNNKEAWKKLMGGQKGQYFRQVARMRLRQFTARFEMENGLSGLLDAVDSAF
jgi:hypothetical protein